MAQLSLVTVIGLPPTVADNPLLEKTLGVSSKPLSLTSGNNVLKCKNRQLDKGKKR
ncbi:hypothetical protein [Serratia marcescens]|uniref:hypothetical protein n=1 Tax=Serratia marcescens TaxID=615 RepID=UPI003FA721D5